jgi:regulator of replication initiation timing
MKDYLKKRYLLMGLMFLNTIVYLLWQIIPIDRNSGLFSSISFLLFGFFLLFVWLFLNSMLRQRNDLNLIIDDLKDENRNLKNEIDSLVAENVALKAPLTLAKANKDTAARLVSKLSDYRKADRSKRGSGQFILKALADEFEICCGVVFLKKKHSDDFCVEGRYGLDNEAEIDISSVTEGLGSQVLVEGNALAHTGVPTRYMRSVSGLGQSENVNIYLLPLIVNGNVVGVAEVGSFVNLPVVAVWNNIKDDLSSLLL